MISYAKAKKLLPPGDVVYIEKGDGTVAEVTVLEVCAEHLWTTAGALAFMIWAWLKAKKEAEDGKAD